jgi:hypothetical protein
VSNGDSNPEAVQFYSNPPGFVPSNQYNGDLIAANWSLTETPLPSTWTLLIAGFAGLGFFARCGLKMRVASAVAARSKYQIEFQRDRRETVFLVALRTGVRRSYCGA